jgi:hypothetical protein
MANSATKLSRFVQANNLTSGVVFHKQLNRYEAIAFPTNVFSGAQSVADCAINNLGNATTSIRGYFNFLNEAAQILTLNGVTFEFTNEGRNRCEAIVVTALPDAVIYDASK